MGAQKGPAASRLEPRSPEPFGQGQLGDATLGSVRPGPPSKRLGFPGADAGKVGLGCRYSTDDPLPRGSLRGPPSLAPVPPAQPRACASKAWSPEPGPPGAGAGAGAGDSGFGAPPAPPEVAAPGDRSTDTPSRRSSPLLPLPLEAAGPGALSSSLFGPPGAWNKETPRCARLPLSAPLAPQADSQRVEPPAPLPAATHRGGGRARGSVEVPPRPDRALPPAPSSAAARGASERASGRAGVSPSRSSLPAPVASELAPGEVSAFSARSSPRHLPHGRRAAGEAAPTRAGARGGDGPGSPARPAPGSSAPGEAEFSPHAHNAHPAPLFLLPPRALILPPEKGPRRKDLGPARRPERGRPVRPSAGLWPPSRAGRLLHPPTLAPALQGTVPAACPVPSLYPGPVAPSPEGPPDSPARTFPGCGRCGAHGRGRAEQAGGPGATDGRRLNAPRSARSSSRTSRRSPSAAPSAPSPPDLHRNVEKIFGQKKF
ncbi:basic proline-rich protein-like [Suncus etruscus]|uniref:basic proline-rich protein-like n=1 Tax=Suncus etruscus TaxID=109475 RepID=UPI00210F8EB0|nr:basic proline-rich protein-like [Suncus etruscus]